MQASAKVWKGDVSEIDLGFAQDAYLTLPRSLRALRGWKRLTPARSRRPHPLKTWFAVAVLLSQAGRDDILLPEEDRRAGDGYGIAGRACPVRC